MLKNHCLRSENTKRYTTYSNRATDVLFYTHFVIEINVPCIYTRYPVQSGLPSSFKITFANVDRLFSNFLLLINRKFETNPQTISNSIERLLRYIYFHSYSAFIKFNFTYSNKVKLELCGVSVKS